MMLQMLAQPVQDPGKKHHQVTSIKVNPEIWEQLGFVAQVLRLDKQDMVAEALLDYFEKIQRRASEQGGM